MTDQSDRRNRDKSQRYDIIRGHIFCPVRGKVDVELCFYCPRLDSVDMDSKRPFIVCHPDQEVISENNKVHERLGLLELAKVLGNVSEACRERGISRRQYYVYKARYERDGLSGLRDGRTREVRRQRQARADSN